MNGLMMHPPSLRNSIIRVLSPNRILKVKASSFKAMAVRTYSELAELVLKIYEFRQVSVQPGFTELRNLKDFVSD
jgi:hypothetical protein